MKKILSTLVITIVMMTAFAQRPHLQLGFSWGNSIRFYNIKALAFVIVVTDTSVTEQDTTIKLTGNAAGFHFGFLFRVSKERKYAEIATNFVRSSVPVFEDGNADSTSSDDATVYGVEIPFLVGYKIVNTPLFKWRASTGFNLGIIGKVKENPQEFVKSDFTNPRVGMRFGTGIDLAMVTFDFYYTLGLTKEFKSVDYRTQSHFIQVSFGFLL